MKIKKLLKDTEHVLKKYSPEILTVVGIASGAAGMVVAVKKTLDLNEKISPVKEEIEEIKMEAEIEEIVVDRKRLTKAYGKGALVLAKTYAIPVALEACSVCCILAANGIMRKRNAGLVAAYTLLQGDFKRYRDNVVAEFGEEKDYDLYHDLVTEKVETIEEDPETGKKKKVKKEVKVKNGLTPYSVLFDERNLNHTDCPSLNMSFINGVELYINQQCKAKGKIFLSEIYDQLGYDDDMLNEKQRLAARIMGKVWDYDNVCDKQISFHVFDKINNRALEAAEHNDSNGENVFILDFDVNDILDDYTIGVGTYR